MIKAVIFDMDGLLVDSEPLWYEGKIEVFAKVGLKLTLEMCRQSSGLRINDIVDYWYRIQTWDTKLRSKEEVAQDLTETFIKIFLEKGQKMPGVDHILSFVREKGVKTALASSTRMREIEIIVDKMRIRNFFDEICSAEFEEYGKPNPAIYINTAKLLNVSPDDCLAFEDSYNGVLAAKSAKMKCVCVPDGAQKDNPRFSIADIKLASLNDFNENVWETLNR